MSPPDDDGGEADPRRPDRTGDRRHGGAGKAVGGERRRTPGRADRRRRTRSTRAGGGCARSRPVQVEDARPLVGRPEPLRRQFPLTTMTTHSETAHIAHPPGARERGSGERRGRKRALFSDGPPRLRLGRDAGFPPPVRPGRRADGMRLCHRPCQRAARSRSERDWAEPDERHAGLDCEHQQRRARLYFLRGRAIAFPPEYHQRGQRPQEQGGTGGGTNREGCHRRNGPMSDILEIYPAAEAR